MEASLTFATQDYLKAILQLSENGGSVSTNALAARLEVSPASVTGMVQKLASAKHPLLLYQKHKGVRLTPAGRRAALEVVRHHRLMESWLVQSLGYGWDEVHAEAERLEHAMSDELEQRIAAALGNPARDPHGEPIPSASLRMPGAVGLPLAQVPAGNEALVTRVRAEDTGLLERLDEIGIRLGVRLKVISTSPFDEVMRIRVGQRRPAVSLGPAITRRVYVDPVDNPGVVRPGSQSRALRARLRTEK